MSDEGTEMREPRRTIELPFSPDDVIAAGRVAVWGWEVAEEDAALLQRLHNAIGGVYGAARRAPLYALHQEIAARLSELRSARAGAGGGG